ncbi:MAG TPA: alanine--tRNA ligase [Dehalococcoidia bacterium]|nr:alanine--tRNA ligase [Dehalococcoidia bacterium]
MTSDEIRAAFLGFFEEKGHQTIPSSSLIPHGDPTLLLTSAGMVQIKPYFLGEAVPPNPRLASCQKCFRTTDIETVGDPTHLTFFEMLGNFSVGDYFKREAIGWAWEFVTERLNLPAERLWVTIFLDDDESFRIWRETGVPESRIVRFGDKDNFWGPAGSSGPCGPCSELHYDFGEEHGCGKATCGPNCDCGRFSEIWNLVFTQYNQDENGQRTPLPRPNIDTGMGLERTAAVVQGKSSVYDTDLFAPLINRISVLAGKKYGDDSNSDNAMRIVAEHSRGLAFLIADGVIPGNEGRGYVLRRLLRRAALFGRRLGLDRPFLAETARSTIEQMGAVYPELVQRQDFILRVIETEEERFGQTLTTGLELLDEIMARAAVKKTREIPGKPAFKLYDTYGFPIEMTREIAAGRGFSVDMAGFEKEMAKQRERARTAHKFDIALEDTLSLSEKISVLKNSGRDITQFVGYNEFERKSTIISLLQDNKSVATVAEGQEASLILEATPFYGEMGGQVGDTGEIVGSSGKFSVKNTIQGPFGIIVHKGIVTQGYLLAGDNVEAVVDRERRLDIARNHTATHLLQYALRQVLGDHVQQRGSLVASDRFSFDFSHLTAMLPDELKRAQQIVNEKIRQNLRVYDEEVPYRQAINEGAIALFDEKYGDTVRVLKIGEPVISAELCGGTHVTATGEIGLFHISGEHSIGAGLRRIEAFTGRGAETFIERQLSDLLEMANKESADAERERKRALALERELGKERVESLLAQTETVNGVKVLSARVPPSRPEVLREMSDRLRDRLKSAVVVLGTVYENKVAFIAAVTADLVAKGYDASKIVQQVAKVAGGGGGGKPNLAQAGGKDKAKLDEALRLVKSLVQEADNA